MLLANLPHTMTHKRNVYYRDRLGASRSKPTTVASAVKCWVQNASANDVLEMQRHDQRVTHTVYLAADAGIRPGDVLVVASAPFANESLTVLSYVEKSVGKSLVWVAFTERKEEPPDHWSN